MTAKNSKQIISQLLNEIEELRQENQTLREQVSPLYGVDRSLSCNPALDHFNAFIVVDTGTGVLTGLNKKAEELFGMSRAELIGTNFNHLHLPVDEKSNAFPDLIDAAENGLDVSIQVADGTVRHALVIAKPLQSDKRQKILLQYNDITDSVNIRDDFLELFNLSLDIICVADLEKEVFELVNPAFTRILGYPKEEVEGVSYLDFLHPDDIEPTIAVVEEQLKKGKAVIDFQNRHRCKNGEYKWLQWFTRPNPNRGKNYAIARDITERRAMEMELRRLATTDPLTGASNRRRFMECAEEEVTRARRYQTKMALISMDIDHFKNINDSYGHHVGDAVLKDLVTLCRSILRTTDVFARMGGEEFSALLIQTDMVDAQIIAERLRDAFQNHICKVEDKGIRFTISIGISELSDDDTSIGELMSRSDKALYKAKRGGRNRVEVE